MEVWNGAERDLDEFNKGLKRYVAQRRGAGEGKLKEGKDPLPFEVMKAICESFMKTGGQDGAFGWLYTLLSWSLMCRSRNTEEILIRDVRWINDALAIYFAHMKNDQDGDQIKFPRHCYGNGDDVRVDILCALGTFFLENSASESGFLFEGGSQYVRYLSSV